MQWMNVIDSKVNRRENQNVPQKKGLGVPVMAFLERSKELKFAEPQDAPGRLPENLLLPSDKLGPTPAITKVPGNEPEQTMEI